MGDTDPYVLYLIYRRKNKRVMKCQNRIGGYSLDRKFVYFIVKLFCVVVIFSLLDKIVGSFCRHDFCLCNQR